MGTGQARTVKRDAGRYLQVDDAFPPHMHGWLAPPMTLAEYRSWTELGIAALNRALEGLPLDRTRYRICRGAGMDRTCSTCR